MRFVLLLLLGACAPPQTQNPEKPGETATLRLHFTDAEQTLLPGSALAVGSRNGLWISLEGDDPQTLQVRSDAPEVLQAEEEVELKRPFLSGLFGVYTVDGWISLEARAPGKARLRFERGGELVDAVSIAVEEAASVMVRITSIDRGARALPDWGDSPATLKVGEEAAFRGVLRGAAGNVLVAEERFDEPIEYAFSGLALEDSSSLLPNSVKAKAPGSGELAVRYGVLTGSLPVVVVESLPPGEH